MKRRNTGCNWFGGTILALGIVSAAAGAGDGRGVAEPRCGSAPPASPRSQDKIHEESQFSIRQRDALPWEAIGDRAPSFDRLESRSHNRIVLPDSTPSASGPLLACPAGRWDGYTGRYADVWGDGDYVYLPNQGAGGMPARVHVIDISNPGPPVLDETLFIPPPNAAAAALIAAAAALIAAAQQILDALGCQ